MHRRIGRTSQRGDVQEKAARSGFAESMQREASIRRKGAAAMQLDSILRTKNCKSREITARKRMRKLAVVTRELPALAVAKASAAASR